MTHEVTIRAEKIFEALPVAFPPRIRAEVHGSRIVGVRVSVRTKDMMMEQEIYQIPHLFERGSLPERLLTIDEAAVALGVYAWQIRRAVQRGSIPSYTPFNSRKLVKLSEIVAHIESTRKGGTNG